MGDKRYHIQRCVNDVTGLGTSGSLEDEPRLQETVDRC
jgi:hypothetical protein